ncbi:MAG: LysR family transcriptional regulator [Proteobacteria bacterium]|nr:LysR family transcriptional regulator [Pseudomonadota bacterium]
MNITLRQLRAFVAIAKAGSFTGAAARLNLTQSALSGLMRELETSLGVQLAHRTTRMVQLSDIGAEFLPLAERVLDDLERALESIAQLKSLNAGVVRIAAPQLIACTLLPEAIAAFRELYPKIDVTVVDCQVEEVSARVFSGEVDLGIGPERIVSSELSSQILFEMPFLAVIPASHALCEREQIAWADLKNYPLISLRGDYARMLNNELSHVPGSTGFSPFSEVSFMTTALGMASAGLGLTVCLPYARSLVSLYRLETRLLVEPVITRKFEIFQRSDRTAGPAPEKFAQFLADYVKQLPFSTIHH